MIQEGAIAYTLIDFNSLIKEFYSENQINVDEYELCKKISHRLSEIGGFYKTEEDFNNSILSFEKECEIINKCNQYQNTLLRKVTLNPSKKIVNDLDEIEEGICLGVIDNTHYFIDSDSEIILLKDMESLGLILINKNNNVILNEIIREYNFKVGDDK